MIGAVVRSGVFVLGTLAALLVLAASAPAATHIGNTNQGRDVKLLTDDQNELERISFRRWKAPCQRGGGKFVETTSFIQPLVRSEPGVFLDRDRYRLRQRQGNYNIWVSAVVRGRQVSPSRWKGVFKPQATVKRNGDVVARCDAGRIRWRVSLQG